MRQASTRTRVRALIQITVLVEVRCLCCELKPCQREITTDKFETEKKYRVHSNIQFTDGLCARQNSQGAAKTFSTLLYSNLCFPTHCDSP